ncbi:PIR Superfamily Protein [Plasmodium ovale curtisi]|uniref:PIR Superfamily Protein n=1 Tax=Plasmodium ovale curtisi TaxID=864141 RepID=A0A1A8WFX2_PLAOA|nr:PIR Superfamily Protein [Plasmodium ovale curtisi]
MAGSTADQLENFLKSLPSYESYKKFDEDVTGDTYKNECTDLKTTNDHVKNVCTKFIRNLESLSKLNTEDEKRNTTFYLTFWIYDKISKIFGLSKKNHGIHFSDILRIGNKYYHRLTKNIFLHEYDPDFKEWEEMKYLYDYFLKNYESIHNCTNPPNSECNKYVNYVSYIKEIYEKHHTECCLYHMGCDGYFKCEKNYNPKYLLSKLKGTAFEFPDDPEKDSSHIIDMKEVDDDVLNTDDNTNPQFFSCKEVKDEDGTPFLSCYIVRQPVKVPKKDIENTDTGQSGNSSFSAAEAIRNIPNVECEELNVHGTTTVIKCKAKEKSQSLTAGIHIKVGEQEQSSLGLDINNRRETSRENIYTSLRWKIGEEALNCNDKIPGTIKYKLCEHIKDLISKEIIEKPPIKTVSKLDLIEDEPVEDSVEEYEEEYEEEEHLENVSNLEVSESTENGKSLPAEDSGKESDTKIYGISVTCREKDTEICKNFKKAIVSIKKREKSAPKVRIHKKRKKLAQETVTVSSTSETRESLLPNTINDTSVPLEETPGILNNSIFRIIVVAALIFGGIIVLFIYFKYTPLGSFIHKNIRRKKEFENDIVGEHDQMISLYDSELLHENSHKKRIHLSYHHTGEDY